VLQRARNAGLGVKKARQELSSFKPFAANEASAGISSGYRSLGTFKFNAGEEAAVIFKTDGAQGNVHIDAVQVVPAK
jgi:hypothetical protein